uniref:protein-serine/threonine phosphatase n=1 Tax=Aceria tosichella TaxID=561515 RepID=A0A6G1SNS3_9ACAR
MFFYRRWALRRKIRMGCYLSKVDDKVYISEGKGRNFQYASASCQGWRREQEDAEVCLSEFDENTSLFILCDGHGGAEVAKYTVAHLPDFIKDHKLYKEGKYEELLTQVLIDFDAHLRTDKVMAELERIAKDEEVKTNEDIVSETNVNSESQADVSAGTSSAGSASEPAAGSSSSAGPSTSTSNGSNSVAEDVDTETLRREAQVPLDELINKYADATTKNRIVSLNKFSKEGGDDNVSGGSSSEQPEPSSSRGSTEEGPSSTSGDPLRSGLDLLKKVYMEYFDDSEDDSEFEGTDDSDDDEDSDDDGDDERDEETPGGRSKKLLSKKHRRVAKNQSDSSSADDGEEEDDDDDDDDDDEDDDGSSDDDADEGGDDEEEDDDEGEEEEEEEDDGGDLLSGRMMAFRKLNQRLNKAQPVKIHKPGMDSGCTVVVALAKDKKLYVASAGDSRCIMIMRDGTCKPMSFDHKPEDPIERKRILSAGGLVCEGRVNGGLNLSRALGDFTYKDPKLDAKDQMITPCPDVEVADLDPDKVEYILLACDGIWNSYDNCSVAKYIQKVAPTMNDLAEICAALFKMCLAPNCDGDGTGCDNMTCILVRYDNSNVTDSYTNNRNDLKLSSTTKNSDENVDGMKEECEEKQSTKRQADGEVVGNSDSKRRCFHLLPRPTES